MHSSGVFFVQEQDADADGDATSSEGIFVAHVSTGVSVGDRVEVTGTVAELFERTSVQDASVVVLSTGDVLPTPADVTMPVASLSEFERVEGMRVRFSQALTVNENYDLARYGQIVLSSRRLMQPTNVVAPGAAAVALQAANDLDRIVLDDGSNVQNLDPVVFPSPQLSAATTLRSGSAVRDLVGVMEFSFAAYRVLPTQAPTFDAGQNPRTSAPQLAAGRLRVASFNVLNYFNGDGNGGGFPTSRGASTASELVRQRDKIVAALAALDADIIGVMEIENDGHAAGSAIDELAAALSAASGSHYAYVDPGIGPVGTDEIAVGLLYRTDEVATFGSAAVLDTTIDPRFDDTKNRPALAQTFAEHASGGRFTVVVNHLKSKGSACDDVGDPDRGDGQGNCSGVRTQAAAALADWMASDPTASGDADVLILGDLNAYAMEDPIATIRSAGYTDLVDRFVGREAGYSYVFSGQAGYLDHALASASLNAQVVGASEWHINADEPRALDYNEEFKSPAQVESFYEADAYRASDHDPVIVGIDLVEGGDAAPSVTVIAPVTESVVNGLEWIRVRVSDDEDIAGSSRVEVSLDGGAYRALTYVPRADEYRMLWNTSWLRRGVHVLQVRATDSAGNVKDAEPVRVYKRSGWWWLPLTDAPAP